MMMEINCPNCTSQNYKLRQTSTSVGHGIVFTKYYDCGECGFNDETFKLTLSPDEWRWIKNIAVIDHQHTMEGP